ncbi:hypothetical protein N8083_01195 [Candidatus Pacebacteria bacterium]|nr:hypothetical protein [Candidatus Paceibacterota bacterium]
MSTTNQNWKEYCVAELTALTPILQAHGFTLDEEQKHLKGERYLMRAVTTTSGKKLILTGTDREQKPVIIKATRNTQGKQELAHERTCRVLLCEIDFAGEIFHTPQEIAYLGKNGFVISIQRFIEQTCPFIQRPIEEQFMYALTAFKGQESTHATTYKHRRRIEKTYNIRDAAAYLIKFNLFRSQIKKILPDRNDIHMLLTQAYDVLTDNKIIMEQYCGFLTHRFCPAQFSYQRQHYVSP